MKLSNIFAIIKKELRSYFDSPTAYIVLVIFLLLWQFLFFRDAFIIAEASLRNLLSYVPWLFLILIPAITMGSIANERTDGTLEFLLTHPLRAIELIVGKFIAGTLFVALALAFMFPVAFSFDQFGDIDWGVVVGQYTAAVLLASTFIALGIFVSSLFANQISALLVAVTSTFIMIIIGFELVTLSLPGPIANFFEQISVLTRFLSLSRGVIDIRDVLFFISIIIVFLSLSLLQLLRLRMGNQKNVFQTYIIGVGLFIGIAVLLNVVGTRIPGRLDLTEEKAYQLSPATQEVLSGLDDVVNIKLYASTELPAQLRPILRDTKDILRDYRTFSNDQVQVEIKDPSRDDQIIREANSLGVREVQFNVIGQENLQVKRGYLGLAVLYEGNTEVIPIVNTATDLEYQLTSFIKKLTTEDKKTLAFLGGHGEKDLNTDYRLLTNELGKLYEIQELVSPVDAESDEELVIDESIDTLVIAGPTAPITEAEREKIFAYFENGGSLLMLLDGVSVQQGSLQASPNDNSLADFLPSFGLSIGQDIVFDMTSNETVSFGGSDGVNYVLPYRFWPRVIADPDTNTTLTKQIRSMVLPWPSSLTLNQETIDQNNYKIDSLFVTTPYAGSQVGMYNIQPDQEADPTDLSEKTMIVSLIDQSQSDVEKAPRAIIAGDSDFLTDSFIETSPENLAFGIESMSWLSQEQSLAEIQLKQRKPRTLIFSDETQIMLVRYGNMAFAFIVPLLISLVRLIRRNRMKQMLYSYE